jgi:hypothetical protein
LFQLFVVLRLLENVGIALVLLPSIVGRCSLPAKVAVDALAIDIELPPNIFRIFIVAIGHDVSPDAPDSPMKAPVATPFSKLRTSLQSILAKSERTR